MIIALEPSSEVPLYVQIAGQVRRAIAAGDLGPGARLAPARAMGDSLGVNMHTVLRAYQVLRDEGLVEMRRSRGVVVTDAAPDEAALVDRVTAFVTEARGRGLSDPEIRSYLEAHL